MSLFRAIVLDGWKRRRAEAGQAQTELEARVAHLQRREAMLEEAFLYEKRIDAKTYERQRDTMREDIALVRIELEDARLEEIDVEGLLGFAEHLLGNAARLWMEATAEQKQRLQRVLFPQGLRLKNGQFGTAVTCLAFKQLLENGKQGNGLASYCLCEESDSDLPLGVGRDTTSRLPIQVQAITVVPSVSNTTAPSSAVLKTRAPAAR